jgi:hypothetical protein
MINFLLQPNELVLTFSFNMISQNDAKQLLIIYFFAKNTYSHL